MSEQPRLAYYLDEMLRTPLPKRTVDFGEIDADGSRTLAIYVVNYGDRDLRKVMMTSNDESVEVLQHPAELLVGIGAKVVLKWTPQESRMLEARLRVRGKYFRLKGS